LMSSQDVEENERRKTVAEAHRREKSGKEGYVLDLRRKARKNSVSRSENERVGRE